MKKLILTVTLLTLAFSFTTAQKKPVVEKETPVKQVQVTAKTISGQPTGKTYGLDLTRKGTIYNLAADSDYSRVRIRTSKGEVALSDLVQKSEKSGRLMVGLISDLRNLKLNLGSPGVAYMYTCQGLTCKCSGDADCNDMFAAGVCGDVASCDNGNGTCECFRKV